jgi:hypothetical protein
MTEPHEPSTLRQAAQAVLKAASFSGLYSESAFVSRDALDDLKNALLGTPKAPPLAEIADGPDPQEAALAHAEPGEGAGPSDAALRAEIARLEQEGRDWAASFALYDDANRRGIALWHQAGGDPDVWPDQAKLVAWLLSERDCLLRVLGSPDSQSLPGVLPALWWVLDMLDQYDAEMLRRGDPPEKVNSAVHVEAKKRSREALEQARAALRAAPREADAPRPEGDAS